MNSELLPEQTNPDDSTAAVDQVGAAAHLIHRRGWHRGPLLLLILCSLLYAVAIPVYQDLTRETTPAVTRVQPMPLDEAIKLQTMKTLAVLWIVALGSTVGSFLNVVAYRMPRGKSVIFNPSQCPKCDSKIRPADNLPVFGWLRLEGRCRSCGNSISAQYPLVEASVATIFLLLFVVVLVTGGINLPNIATPRRWGIVGVVFELQWPLIELYAYHCVLFCIAFAWVLVDLQLQRVTWLAILTCIAILAIPIGILPHLTRVPIDSTGVLPHSALPAWLNSLVGAAVGSAVGLLLCGVFRERATEDQVQRNDASEKDSVGSLPEDSTADVSLELNSAAAQFAADTGPAPTHWLEDGRTANLKGYLSIQHPRNVISLLTFLGISLGWQAVVSIAMLSLALRLAVAWWMRMTRFPLPLSCFLCSGLVGHHLLWRWIADMICQCWTLDQPYLLLFSSSVAVSLVVLNRATLTATSD